MQERHTNRDKYFKEQGITTDKYVIPFIGEDAVKEGARVLEIGCGEGGNLIPFLERGCDCVGVDLSEGKINNGNKFFADHPEKDKLNLICKDVFDLEGEQFDIVFMRDVLEHIHNQEKFMKDVKKFLKPNTRFFLGFPPWYNPFGGHQQVCESKFLSKLPYFHILPKFMYKGILKLFGETPEKIEILIEVKDTGISIERFRRILRREGYSKDKEVFYFINPNYEVKFGMKPKEHWKFLSAIPFLRNFTITTNYYVISHPGGKD